MNRRTLLKLGSLLGLVPVTSAAGSVIQPATKEDKTYTIIGARETGGIGIVAHSATEFFLDSARSIRYLLGDEDGNLLHVFSHEAKGIDFKKCVIATWIQTDEKTLSDDLGIYFNPEKYSFTIKGMGFASFDKQTKLWSVKIFTYPLPTKIWKYDTVVNTSNCIEYTGVV